MERIQQIQTMLYELRLYREYLLNMKKMMEMNGQEYKRILNKK